MLHPLGEINFSVVVFRISVMDEDGKAPFVAYPPRSTNELLKLQEVGGHRGDDHVDTPIGLDVVIRWEVDAPALILVYDKHGVPEATCQGKSLYHCG